MLQKLSLFDLQNIQESKTKKILESKKFGSLDPSGFCFHILTNPLHNLSSFNAILHEFLGALLFNFLSH